MNAPVTGLFIHRTRSHKGPGRAYTMARQQAARRKLEALRDLVADEDISIATAAYRLGINVSHAHTMWRTIRQEVEAMGLMIAR